MKITICNQTGATLIISLILLVALTLLSLSAMNISMTEQKISANSQHKMGALQLAQSVVDATVDSASHFKVIGNTSTRYCFPASLSSSDPDCTETYDISTKFSSMADTDFASKITGKIIRLNPETVPAPRGIETSADKYDVALFEVEGSYDDSAAGYGRSTVGQGYLILVPKSGQ